MESQDPLSELADIHLPGDVSAWPPAIGWWLLGGLVIIGIVYAAQQYLSYLSKQKHLRAATSELEKVYHQYQAGMQTISKQNQAGLLFLQKVNSILRRVALLKYSSLSPHSDLASSLGQLHGNSWLSFLDSCDNSTDFCTGPGQALAEGLYQPQFSGDAEAIYELAKAWIKRRYDEKPLKQLPSQNYSAQVTSLTNSNSPLSTGLES